MSIAINLKVNDGVVLAADSASTIGHLGPDGKAAVANVYNNANKLFNLVKGLPIGLITWGAGGIGSASISTLVKDLRKQLASEAKLDPTSYTIEDVAKEVKRFMFDEQYTKAFEDWETMDRPSLGFVVAGYSSDGTMADEYRVTIENGGCSEPSPLRSETDSGISWHGQTEAIQRLIYGFSSQLGNTLREKLGVPEDQIEPAVRTIAQSLRVQLTHPAMPIQDAINLAEFLVDVTIRFYQYSPGAPIVGGPIEVAAITKHEGFKWIRRKHYYPPELNLGGNNETVNESQSDV